MGTKNDARCHKTRNPSICAVFGVVLGWAFSTNWIVHKLTSTNAHDELYDNLPPREPRQGSWTLFPSVSVVIPFHNWTRKNSLDQAIESVVFQTYPGRIEVVLIDTSRNAQAALELNNHTRARPHKQESPVQIRVWQMEQPNGTWAGFTRNRGIERARGQYVAFMDSDDAYLPEGLERLFRFASLYNTSDFFGSEALSPNACRRDRDTGMFHQWKLLDPNSPIPRTNPEILGKWRRFFAERHGERLGRVKGRTKDGQDISPPITHGRMLPRVWDYSFLEWHNCIVTSNVVVRRSLLEHTKFDESIRYAEDWDLWKRLLQLPGVRYGYFSEPTAVIDHCHGDSPTEYNRDKRGPRRRRREEEQKRRQQQLLQDQGKTRHTSN